MSQLSNNLSVDLANVDNEFKEWFHDQINKAMINSEAVNKNSLVFLSFNVDESKNNLNNSIVRSIIFSDKAYDINTIENPKENEDNVIKFLRESICELYQKNLNIELLETINRKIETKQYIDDEANLADLWSGFLKSISDYTKWLTHFAQKCPGFHKFDLNDLSNLVYGASLPLYTIMHSQFIRNDDCYIVFENNIIYSNKNIKKLYTKNLSNLVIVYFKKLSQLGLTDSEKALMHPFVLLSCDINLIKAKDYLIELKSFYINALLNEFKTNNRDEEFSKNLMDVFKLTLVLELNKDGFKCIKLDS